MMAARRRHLSTEQRATLQRLLEASATALRGEIGEDRLADLNAEPEAAALERDVVELRAVEDASSRLHAPEFGVCAECSADIPFERLLAAPSAHRCLACQTRHERAGAHQA
jgi:RNA polymerase-binding transcription factor DksA